MTYSPPKKRYIIAVYDTKSSSADLTYKGFQHVIGDMGLDNDIALEQITGRDIQNGILSKRRDIGLVLPGRTRGTHYREEIQPHGFRLIRDAAHEWLNIFGVCAGPYVLSDMTHWTERSNGQVKLVKADYPLFDGMSKGPVDEWYQNNYGYPITDPSVSLSYGHPPSIVSVYKTDGDPEPITIKYGGGGEFLPYHPQSVHVTLRHADNRPAAIRLYPNKKTRTRIDMFNVHPEMTQSVFMDNFKDSPVAKNNPEKWESDMTKFQADQPKRNLILADFIENCWYSATGKPYISNEQRLVA